VQTSLPGLLLAPSRKLRMANPRMPTLIEWLQAAKQQNEDDLTQRHSGSQFQKNRGQFIGPPIL
jgi:hypothetical protein